MCPLTPSGLRSMAGGGVVVDLHVSHVGDRVSFLQVGFVHIRTFICRVSFSVFRSSPADLAGGDSGVFSVSECVMKHNTTLVLLT